MSPSQTMSKPEAKIQDAVRGIAEFAKLERVLAILCVLVPAFLMRFDPGPTRDSISAYYDMVQSQFFYMPLTGAAMLFLVNGVVKERRPYNLFLGAALALLTFFNLDDFSTLHGAFALAFFGGNTLVILFFSSQKKGWFRGLILAVIAVTLLLWWRLDGFTLFWAEWVSLAVIAVHYVLESWSDDG